MNRLIAARSDHTTRTSWTASPRNRERAFRSARRHSRLVRVLRLSLSLVAVLGLSVTILFAYFNPLRMLAKSPIDVGKLVVSGSKVTMEHPRMSGFTGDARSYNVTATAATQDITKPDLLELSHPQGKMQMQDKSIIELSAEAGIYNNKTEKLILDRNIVVTSSTGYKGYLSEAKVDISKGNMVSDHPVKVEMLQGTLNAKRMEIIDSGDLARFSGGVTMDLMLNEEYGSDGRGSKNSPAMRSTTPTTVRAR